jgi:hypothetical protein
MKPCIFHTGFYVSGTSLGLDCGADRLIVRAGHLLTDRNYLACCDDTPIDPGHRLNVDVPAWLESSDETPCRAFFASWQDACTQDSLPFFITTLR